MYIGRMISKIKWYECLVSDFNELIDKNSEFTSLGESASLTSIILLENEFRNQRY